MQVPGTYVHIAYLYIRTRTFCFAIGGAYQYVHLIRNRTSKLKDDRKRNELEHRIQLFNINVVSVELTPPDVLFLSRNFSLKKSKQSKPSKREKGKKIGTKRNQRKN